MCRLPVVYWNTCKPFHTSPYHHYGARHNDSIPFLKLNNSQRTEICSHKHFSGLFRRLVFRFAGSDGSEGRFRSSESTVKPRSSPMLLVVKQRQKRMRTLIKKQALDTRTRFHGAGDRGRTGTVSLPSDFESDTSANSITPAHNTMIIAYFFHFVKQTASKFCIYSFVYFQHKTYLTTLDFWRIL